VANKELTAYVKWKSAEALENKGAIPRRLHVGREQEEKTFGLKDVTPAVFVSLGCARDKRVRNKGLKWRLHTCIEV
jgi:hypothetical protein